MDLGVLGGRQRQLERLACGLELRRRARADDHGRHARVLQQPGEREAGHADASLDRRRLERLERVERLVDNEVGVGLGPHRHARPGWGCRTAAVLPGQPASRERRERREAEAELGERGEQLALGLPFEQAVGVLHPAEAGAAVPVAQPERVDELPGGHVARADVVDRPCAHEVVERAERLVERRVRVGLVREEQVEMARAEALQAPLDLALQVPAREAVVVRAVADGVERLARQQHLVAHRRALAGQPAADRRLAAPTAVGVCRVEDVDAEVERGVHDPRRLVVVLALAEERGRRSDASEVATAEDDARDLDAGRAERDVVHQRAAGWSGARSASFASSSFRRSTSSGVL